MAKATTAILLAAGEGKRMVSKKQKVMHNLCGRPMLGWVMRSVQQHITERPIVVLGFDGESVRIISARTAPTLISRTCRATGWTPSGPA